jgi:photosystem II stability/assembly factor-like uncharacterized protein
MTIEFSSPDSAARAMAAGGGGGRGGAGGGRGGGVPRPPARWRVRAGTIVERSIDQGITWEPIATDSAATITAGAAPTPVVCWLVGRGGLVLLMTDNQHFVRVKFPEEVDLAAVTAPNARQATVTTADGRVFVTTDAGATWRLQGFPTASF